MKLRARHIVGCLFCMMLVMPSAFGAIELFTIPGATSFLVPAGVTSVNVLAIGGGGGGANGHQGGGGSGYVSFGTFSVTPGGSIAITVGMGGNGAATDPFDNNIVGLTPGTASSFGSFLMANGGGVVSGINQGGQNGGSGGGGAGNAGPGGAGGSGGSNGFAATHAAGFGQGDYTASLLLFTESVVSAGAGGAAGTSSHSGGGGGGGILINGAGPSAEDGIRTYSAKGGIGFGAGGGAGGYSGFFTERPAGGDGASGLVYVEYLSPVVDAVPEPASVIVWSLLGVVCLKLRRS